MASFRRDLHCLRGSEGTWLVSEAICTVWARSVLTHTMPGFVGTEIQGNDASDLMKG